jgi:hypothetical protein
MASNDKNRKRTPGQPPVDKLFADSPQYARDALAMHKDAKRNQDRANYRRQLGINPEVST